jgi:C-terminal processing protease CtpA/Prc
MNDAQLVKGGSAQMNGAIAAGDVVTRIDSIEFTSSVCENSSSALASVKDVTSGVCGSTLVLHVFRPSDGRTYEATLTRGNAQSVAFSACCKIVYDSLHFVAVTFL